MKLLVAFTVALVASSVNYSASATTLTSYPTVGIPNSEMYSFTALATGHVTGFFAGADAADISLVGLSVNGATPIVFGLNNQTSAISQSLDFGPVVAGDSLTFVLSNQTTGIQFFSNPVSNPDGLQYVFSAGFTSSGGAIPTGVQISFEDRAKSQGSDFDYNDASFVFTNVTTGPVDAVAISANPLPGALILLAGGLSVFGSAFLLGRKRGRRA